MREEMSMEFLYLPTQKRDGKFGIKSSMPKLKEGIAWLILLYLSAGKSVGSNQTIQPMEEYQDQDDKTQIKLTASVRDAILSYYTAAGITKTEVIKTLEDSFGNCTLTTTQLEPMIVAYEIFLPLAECDFADNNYNKSAERAGGQRFSKSFKFASGLRRLAFSYDLAPTAFLFLMAEWIHGKKFDVDEELRRTIQILENKIREQIFDLSARTVFRYEDEDSNKADHYFNIIGLYRGLLRGSVLKLAKNREDKGTLRVLKNAVKSKLLPGLVISQNEFLLDSKFDQTYLENLVEERKNYEILSEIDVPDMKKGSLENQSTRKEKSSVKNMILYGVPGSGKSFTIDRDYVYSTDFVERVVFHPDYMYANFIGQVLPVVSNGEVSYEFVPGPFTNILKKAIKNPSRRHVLIIEEINRGNAAAIFGDVFQLLDRSPTGESRYGIHNRDLSVLIHGDMDSEVKIPENLVLLATMNTSDQNVYTLDTAFQRRWSMAIVPNNFDDVPWANVTVAGTSVTWRRFATEINHLIIRGNDSLSSSEDKRLGAFFVSEQDLSADSAKAFAEKVLKYLWDDAFRFNRAKLFKDAESRTLEDIIHVFAIESPEKRWGAVFNEKIVNNLVPVDNTVANADSEKTFSDRAGENDDDE